MGERETENYIHGGDVYRRPVELDFSININPFGMPEAVREAAMQGVMQSTRYPDWASEKLCRAASEYFGLPVYSILPGNGAAELIYALTAALKPHRGFVLAPGFMEYEKALEVQNAAVSHLFLQEAEKYRLSVPALLTALDVMSEGDVVFLCNPNNPTGELLRRDALLQILEKTEAQGGWLVIDECFLPFLKAEEAETMLPFLLKHPRLMVLRAFTKLYAMPGLRLGLLLSGNETFLRSVRRQLQPWNISIPAQLAGEKAFSQKEYVRKTKEYMSQERAWLAEEVRPLCRRLYPGEAGFLLFRAPVALYEGMLARGVLLRDCSSFAGLEKGHYRICVGRHEDNLELLRRWKQWQSQS